VGLKNVGSLHQDFLKHINCGLDKYFKEK